MVTGYTNNLANIVGLGRHLRQLDAIRKTAGELQHPCYGAQSSAAGDGAPARNWSAALLKSTQALWVGPLPEKADEKCSTRVFLLMTHNRHQPRGILHSAQCANLRLGAVGWPTFSTQGLLTAVARSYEFAYRLAFHSTWCLPHRWHDRMPKLRQNRTIPPHVPNRAL